MTAMVCASAEAPAGYDYVKSHNIAGSSDGALSDYQVRFVVHNGSGTDSGQDVYLNNHAYSWPNDIVFTDSSDNVLSYWAESSNASQSTIWVKVPSIPASGTTVKLYYGKSGETSRSDIDGTFVFGDHFTSFNTTSKWNTNSYATIQSGTEIKITTPGQTYYECNAISTRSSDFSTGQAIMVRLRGNSGTAHYNFHFPYVNDANRIVIRGEYQSTQTTGTSYNSGSSSSTGNICSDKGNYHKYEIRRSPAGNSIAYYVDDVLKASTTTNVYSGTGQIMLGPWVGGSQVWMDWIAVRKYTANEPAHGTWGAETMVVRSPVAAFAANVTGGAVLLTVQFWDNSTSSPTAWQWDFGDGSANSTVQNPIHTYNVAGNYTVTLTASNSYGNGSLRRSNYIWTVWSPEIIIISNTPTSQIVQLEDALINLTAAPDHSSGTVKFTNLTTGDNITLNVISTQLYSIESNGSDALYEVSVYDNDSLINTSLLSVDPFEPGGFGTLCNPGTDDMQLMLANEPPGPIYYYYDNVVYKPQQYGVPIYHPDREWYGFSLQDILPSSIQGTKYKHWYFSPFTSDKICLLGAGVGGACAGGYLGFIVGTPIPIIGNLGGATGGAVAGFFAGVGVESQTGIIKYLGCDEEECLWLVQTLEPVEFPQPVFAAECTGDTRTSSMLTGESKTVTITMKNTGTVIWSTTSSGIRLEGDNNDAALFDANRHDISGTVFPGESCHFTFQIVAPQTAGQYAPEYKMVHRNLNFPAEWFGYPAGKTIAVASPTPTPAPTPTPTPTPAPTPTPTPTPIPGATYTITGHLDKYHNGVLSNAAGASASVYSPGGSYLGSATADTGGNYRFVMPNPFPYGTYNILFQKSGYDPINAYVYLDWSTFSYQGGEYRHVMDTYGFG